MKCWVTTQPTKTMQYRRSKSKGATYFFTVNLADRNQSLLVDHIGNSRISFKNVKSKLDFKTDAIVILPDHLHSIWTLPIDDADYPTRWRLIKSSFSKSLPKTEVINDSRKNKSERGIWQRRYWEHQIKNDEDYRKHMDYIYYNPVKHKHVDKVIDWPHSSFHRDVENGLYTKDWETNVTAFAGESIEDH